MLRKVSFGKRKAPHAPSYSFWISDSTTAPHNSYSAAWTAYWGFNPFLPNTPPPLSYSPTNVLQELADELNWRFGVSALVMVELKLGNFFYDLLNELFILGESGADGNGDFELAVLIPMEGLGFFPWT